MTKKRFGQNFLQDVNIINNIVSAINPKLGERIIEIGPGFGALTQRILPIVKSLDVIEIDKDLIPTLQTNCQSLGDLRIHQADALTVDFHQFAQNNKKLRIIGNLPYNISTPLLFHSLKFRDDITDMHFMLQKEVVERICATPTGKTYGRLSVMLQYHCQTERLFNVSPQCFRPEPKVKSAVIRLKPHLKLPLNLTQYEKFQEIVKQAFCQRRKTLYNSLKNIISRDQWQMINIDPTLRPERLTVKDFIQITQSLFS